MVVSNPGTTVVAVKVVNDGEISFVTAAGDTLPGGAMPGFVRGWVVETGHIVLEREDGSQTMLCNPSGPFTFVHRHMSGPASVPRLWTGAVTTDSTGTATFTIPDGYFTTVYNAQATVERNTTAPVSASFSWISEWTTTRVIVRVAESKTSGVLVGGSIEGNELSGAGILVHAFVIGA